MKKLFFLIIIIPLVSCSRELLEPIEKESVEVRSEEPRTKSGSGQNLIETPNEAAFRSQSDPHAKFIRQLSGQSETKFFSLSEKSALEIGIDNEVIQTMSFSIQH